MTGTQRRRGTGRATTTLAAAGALTLAFGGLAHADNIQDTIADTGTGITLVAGSTTPGSAGIRVIGNSSGGDPDAGCNIDAGENDLKLDIVTPTGVTAAPDPLSITGCGTDFSVSFTAGSTAQSGHVTVTILSVPAGGGTYLNQVDIPITITQPNTPPTVSVTGVNATSYVIGDEPTPDCSVVDAEQPTATATPTVDTTGLVNGLGSVTVTCSFTDAGGLSDSDTLSYTIVPPPNTAPSVTVTGIDSASYEIGSEPTPGCSVVDAEQPTATATPSVDRSLQAHGLGLVTVTCSFTDDGELSDSDTATYSVVDTADPTITHTVVPATPNGNGWYNADVAVAFTCADAGGSGIQSCTGDTILGEGVDQSATGTATDWAGNTATDSVSDIDVDKTMPTVGFTGGPGAGVSYYFGSVPAAPTCVASDALSGLDTCTVGGGGTTVGSHSYTASATDLAGNTATATVTYTVLAWSLRGFYSPVDMSSTATSVWNTVKGGSTVPLKFEVFAGSELTGTSAIRSFTQRQVSCPGGSPITDDIEITTTGGTSLRYDATAGQFIQNWATAKKPGTCYVVTMTSQDGSSISATFMLK